MSENGPQSKEGIESEKHPERPWRDESLLRELYVVKGMTQHEIGELLGCSRPTVMKWMRRGEVDARGHSERVRGRNAATFRTKPSGYEQWYSDYHYNRDTVYVHRLLAVSEFGFEAVVNSHVHHGAGEEGSTTPWDNRPQNIKLLSESGHGEHHAENRERRNDGTFA